MQTRTKKKRAMMVSKLVYEGSQENAGTATRPGTGKKTARHQRRTIRMRAAPRVTLTK